MTFTLRSGPITRYLKVLASAGVPYAEVARRSGLAQGTMTNLTKHRSPCTPATVDTILSLDPAEVVPQMDDEDMRRVLAGIPLGTMNPAKRLYAKELHRLGWTQVQIAGGLSCSHQSAGKWMHGPDPLTLDQVEIARLTTMLEYEAEKTVLYREAWEAACVREEKWRTLAESIQP